MFSLKKINSHYFASAGTLLICFLIFALFQSDLSGDKSGQMTDAEIDDLELLMEDMMAENINDDALPKPDGKGDVVNENSDKASESTSTDKGSFKVSDPTPAPLPESIIEEKVVAEDTVMKKIEVMQALKVDSVKTLPDDVAVVAEIREIAKAATQKQGAERQYHKDSENYKFYQKNYRNIRNFKKVYPYALKTRDLMADLDARLSQIESESERKKLIKETEKILFQQYETAVRTMSVAQGKLLLKLIARETDKTGYEIIKNYRGAFSATFWYGVGKIFGTDLKTEFHKEQDSIIETIVEKYKNDELD